MARVEKPKQGKVRKVLTYVVIVCAALVGFSAGAAMIDSRSDKESTSNLLTGKESKEYISTEHGFKAVYPGLPSASRETVDIEGYSVTQVFYARELGSKYYTIAVADCPPEFDMSDTKSRLQGALNGSAQNVQNGRVLNSFFTTFAGYDAIDGVIAATDSGQDVTLYVRDFLIGNRLYTIMTMETTEEEYINFRNSFQLL